MNEISAPTRERVGRILGERRSKVVRNASRGPACAGTC